MIALCRTVFADVLTGADCVVFLSLRAIILFHRKLLSYEIKTLLGMRTRVEEKFVAKATALGTFGSMLKNKI